MKKRTPIQQLIDQLEDCKTLDGAVNPFDIAIRLATKKLEVEKTTIIDAHNAMRELPSFDEALNETFVSSGEYYYSQKFDNKKR